VTAASVTSVEPGSPSATTDELVTTHIPLVGHIVRETMQRLPTHVVRDDLISAGMLALVLASRGFDPERGVPFARFAAIRIRGAITDELRSTDWATRAVRVKSREVEAVRSTLAARLYRSPSREEVAQAMGVSVGELDALDGDVARASVLSLQSLTVDESADLLPSRDEAPESTLMRREQLGMLADAIAELPERMRIVIEGHFFEQRKMADIAQELGVTESRISQLRTEALHLLRAGVDACNGTPPEPPAGPLAPPTRGRDRTAVRAAYCSAVSTRSTLAERLRVTTVRGELLPLREGA
jgi:RNA polymerase sigma factor for flagellar operon FliA